MATVATQPLTQTIDELDGLFSKSPAGPIPTGRGYGTALIAPGTRYARPIAELARVAFWQGKQFDAERRGLVNLLSPLSIPAIRAEVYEADSWIDHRPCIVLDYSTSSKVARMVRDEIREVAPGEYLGVVFIGHRLVPVRFHLRFS